MDAPDPAKVRAAVEKATKDGADGRVLKVLYLDEKGDPAGEYASTQLPENPWESINSTMLIEPPYPMAQLTFLAEMHPVHSSALEQKTADVCGKGWTWMAENPDNADEKARDELEDWWQSLAPDEFDMRELIQTAWLDVETVGWGLIECAREPGGKLAKLYHVPAHTVKAHKNGYALCQARDSRKVWFRRWGATDMNGQRVEVNAKNGSITNVPDDQKANDLFVIKKPSRRSTWYGIPGYVSAIGWITLALAARDDNLFFFANRREPRWAIILTGMSDDTVIEEDLRRAFMVDMKQPYRNIIVPVGGKDAKVDFQKLSDTQKDGSFEKLGDRADKAIMVAHRVPAERLANSTVGALGGNIASEANRVYKEGVISEAQEVLNSRLNRFIAIEHANSTDTDVKPGDKNEWLIQMDDLDIRSDREDMDQAIILFHGDMITLREARHRLGMGPLMKPAPVPLTNPDGSPKLDPITSEQMHGAPEPGITQVEDPGVDEDGNPLPAEEVESEFNDMLFSQLPGATPAAGMPNAAVPGTGKLTPDVTKSLEETARDLVRSTHAMHERVARVEASLDAD